jgi:hypothetical protein
LALGPELLHRLRFDTPITRNGSRRTTTGFCKRPAGARYSIDTGAKNEKRSAIEKS